MFFTVLCTICVFSGFPVIFCDFLCTLSQFYHSFLSFLSFPQFSWILRSHSLISVLTPNCVLDVLILCFIKVLSQFCPSFVTVFLSLFTVVSQFCTQSVFSQFCTVLTANCVFRCCICLFTYLRFSVFSVFFAAPETAFFCVLLPWLFLSPLRNSSGESSRLRRGPLP